MKLVGKYFPKDRWAHFLEGVPDLPHHPVVGLHHISFTKKHPINPTLSPVVMLHGLFGSSKDWRMVGRETTRITQRLVQAFDLRNHGNSPHASPMDYNTMAKDVIHMLKSQKMKNSILVGHSMGAKVAMLVALYEPELVLKLVVVDNSPVAAVLGDTFHNDLVGLCEVERQKPNMLEKKYAKLKNRIDWAYALLRPFEHSHAVRMFLLSNFRANPPTLLSPKLKIPVYNFLKDDIILKVGEWPEEAKGLQFAKPVKVLKALESDFILPEHMDVFHAYFPNLDYEERNTTHWLVSDDPKAFVRILVDFIDKPTSCT